METDASLGMRAFESFDTKRSKGLSCLSEWDWCEMAGEGDRPIGGWGNVPQEEQGC